MITLIAEFLFAVIFLRALVTYARSRDGLHRDVMLMFTAAAMLFFIDMATRLGITVPLPVTAASTVLLMLTPYLTLRLAARIRPVRPALRVCVLIFYVAVAVPVAIAPRPLAFELLVTLAIVFAVTEMIAAGCFAAEARRRAGSARTRLMLAALASVAFGAAVATVAMARFSGANVEVLRGAGRVVALVAALGYACAFVPPPWLRRVWSANAAYMMSQRLQQVPVTATAGEVWAHYATVVREAAGADSVVVLVARRTDDGTDGPLEHVASTGTALEPPPGANARHLRELVEAHQPIRLQSARHARTAARTAAPALVGHYADDPGARYVTALPVQSPDGSPGAVLLLNRYRSMFTDDDRRMVAHLGDQAAILAERGNVLAEQQRLSAELAVSVAALTRASQAKSDFLAGMSHELRTPLNAIIGFSDLMRAEQPKGDERTVPADWVEHIHSSGRHLLGLINDILDLAKVEAGRMELHIERLPVDIAIADVLTALRPLTDRKDLVVEARTAPLTVLADPIRFRQILDNLLSNAIKFTPEGGKITITADATGTGEVEIVVADTGVGIAPEDQSRVFDEFQQVGDAGQRKAGTGLGLALTRRLVDAHGGEVTLTSALGEGSRFAVRLPGAEGYAEADADQPSTLSAGHRQVLLIEDDAKAAELMRTYLVQAGYDVRVARTGEAGLAEAARKRPDAILLDVLLPGIDGWEVIRQLKADEKLCAVPVFFATVLDERRAGIALGAVEYFVKPVDHDAMLAQLARHVMPTDHATVLVVDRDPQTRKVVEESLRADGVDVVACDDGREGLRLSQAQHFDLIICDLQMPDVDGFTLLSALDADPTTRSVPVLALTAPDLNDTDPDGLVGKVVGTVPKGAAGAELREWVALASVAGERSG